MRGQEGGRTRRRGGSRAGPRWPYSPLPQVEQSSQGSSNFDPHALPHEPSSLRPRLAFEASELGLQEGSGHPRLVGTAQLWGHSRGWGLVGFLGSGCNPHWGAEVTGTCQDAQSHTG